MQGNSTTSLKRMLTTLDRFWFIELSPHRLAVLRLLVGAFALYYLCDFYDMLVRIGRFEPWLYRPVGMACFFATPLPPLVFKKILVLTIAANIAFLLGSGFRYSGPIFSTLLLFVFCYKNSWSMIYHAHNLLVLHAVVLGWSRAGDALSVDWLASLGWSQWRSRGISGWLAGVPSAHWRYGWPIRLMCMVTALAYFLAGVAKIAGPLGWSWALGEPMRSQVAVDAIRKELLGGTASSLAFALYDELWLFAAMGVATLAVELGAPLAAVCDKRILRTWATLVFAFHWGIFAVMGIKFWYQLSGIALASFFLCGRTSTPSERPETIATRLTNVAGHASTN